MHSDAKIELADYFLIAEEVLGIPAETLQRMSRLALAESALGAPHASFAGEDFYPDVATQGAILCSRIVANHALPDGNKRVGFIAMLEFFNRQGITWMPPKGGQDEIAKVIEDLAAGELSEDEFVEWVKARTAP